MGVVAPGAKKIPCTYTIRIRRTKLAWVCGRSFAGIVGSNPADGMDDCPVWILCCTGRCFCDGPITRTEKSYRVCVCVCVCMCVCLSIIRCNNNSLHPHWADRRCQTKKERRKFRYAYYSIRTHFLSYLLFFQSLKIRLTWWSPVVTTYTIWINI